MWRSLPEPSWSAPPVILISYVQQNMLSEKEAVDLRTLYGIDERLAKGEIDEAEANRLRSEISEGVRDKIQQRLRAAVDHSVHYLNVFEALGRLPKERDGALEFLIDFADLVAADEKDVELAGVTKALEEDDELVENLGILMERKDHGIRMLFANMPPFRHVFGPGEKIGKWVIEAKVRGRSEELEHRRSFGAAQCIGDRDPRTSGSKHKVHGGVAEPPHASHRRACRDQATAHPLAHPPHPRERCG